MSAAHSLNSFFERFRPLRHDKLRFVLAVGFVVAALLLTELAQTVRDSSVFLTFAAAIVTATAIYGFLAGTVAALLAAITVDFFYIPPIFALNMDSSTLRITIQFGLLVLGTNIITRKISNKIRHEAFRDEVSRAKIGIHGQLDDIVDGEAYGWAFDGDNPSRPVSLIIYVNHRPVAEVAAVYYRSDVATNLSCSGRHGFYVDLRDHCPPETQAIVDVRISPPTSFTNCPMQATIPGAVVKRPPTILFMHIPKTAGTAFREAVVANYKESEIAYLYPDPPGFLVEDLRLLPAYQRSCFRLVIGHFQYGIDNWLSQASSYITIVRHPFVRVVSHYLYLSETKPWLVTEDAHLLPLGAVLEQHRTVDLDNTIVRYFSGVDEKDVPPGMVNQDVYDLAIHHLRTQFAFIGHQECASRSYSILQELFDWRAKRELGLTNRNTKTLPLMEQEEARKAVEHYNHWDHLLHDEILRLFPRD